MSTKGPTRQQMCIRSAVALALGGMATVMKAGQLPVPCISGNCGSGAPITWVQPGSGQASFVQGANYLNVNQTTNSAILNWRSFNISAGNSVTFTQPSSSATALNRIYPGDSSPSQIFGALNSNGRVYLLNQNGIIFGSSAVVNVGGLLASSLSMTNAAQSLGIAGAVQQGQPAFQPYAGPNGTEQPSGNITVQSGATITSTNGQVLLFAPNVDNEGSIATANGQTILAAGQQIFLASSTDPDIRGLLIQVGHGGTVTNGSGSAASVPTISADAGNVTLAGLAVNQDGRVSATTTVRANGSILLQAQDTTSTTLPGTNLSTLNAASLHSGTLQVGPSSVTEVTLQGSTSDETVDANVQPKSSIELSGGQIDVGDGAQILATSGNVTLNALSSPELALTAAATQPDSSRIYIAPSAVIDVSGADISESVSDNSLAVQLRGSELEDSPLQRNGPLRGLTVYVDMRDYGTNSDGTTWVGSPIGDLTADLATVQRDVFQRNLTGGTITLNASGSVIVSPGATLNTSGGEINWQSGYVKTSTLVSANGQLTPISQANPDQVYVGTLDSISQSDPHWGTSVLLSNPGYNPRGTYEQGYVQGMDAGTLSITTPQFVLDGNVQAGAVIGTMQRLPDTAIPSGQLYRYANQVPLGGQLVIGNSAALNISDSSNLQREVVGGVTFSSADVLPTLSGPAGSSFDPETDPLPANYVSTLRPSLIGPDDFTRLSVYAQGTVDLPAGTTLAPGPGGSVTLAGGVVDVAGSITAPGGSVVLQSNPTVSFGGTLGGGLSSNPLTDLDIAPGVSIDTRGEWINDSPVVTGAQPLPLFISGGSVTLTAVGGSLDVASGVSINVGGGAQRTSSGALVAGRGGSISIVAQPSSNASKPGLSIVEDASLSGLALVNGGTLALSFPTLCVSAAACPDPRAFEVNPSLLTDDGFENVSLVTTSGSSGTALLIAPDVNVDLRQENLTFAPTGFSAPSAPSLAGLTTVTTLPQFDRAPENLSLSAGSGAGSLTGLQFADVKIAAGASLGFDPLAQVSVTTNSRVFMDGTIIDPGGSVSLAIAGDVLDQGDQTIIPNQAIWLGSNSDIDVSGQFDGQPNSTGLPVGSVLGGGNITVAAARGYLIALPGSQLTANGSNAVVAVPSPGTTTYTYETVGSAGGSITLSASEGLQLAGSLSATAGATQVPGGSLSIDIDGDAARAGNQNFGNPSTLQGYAPRTLTVSAGSAPTIVGEGSAVPAFLNGIANIPAASITQGGFDRVTLSAQNLTYFNGSSNSAYISPGAVVFDAGVTLSPGISLVVNSPEIRASGTGPVTLNSPYVSLGSADGINQSIDPGIAAGPGSLTVNADLIDLVGAFAFNQFGSVLLNSTGDIRAIGIQPENLSSTSFSGLLTTPGSLTLQAQQIYPTSLTDYQILLSGSDPTLSQLNILKSPGTAGAVLSAAGSMTLQANNIYDSGVLRAPVGQIVLDGDNVHLADGAIVSASTDGEIIPFGETQGGFDWVYSLVPGVNGTTAGAVTRVYGVAAGDAAPPAAQVTITATNLQFDSGATVDLAGGGDLLAYEFVPGLGGTRDVLSPAVSPNTYAVVPNLNLAYAPIDPNEDRGFTAPVGASVYLSGGDGLPAGTYALLPPRYALLPGAFLVTPVSGYSNLTPGQQLSQLDGSVIVSGYLTSAGSSTRSSLTSGFEITPGSFAQQEAQYNLTSANDFFASEAATAGLTTPQIPADAGSLVIAASQSANLQGRLLGTPATGARGATVDFTAANIFVTNDPSNAPAGYVALNVSQIDQLGAQSIVLGATRSEGSAATTLSVDTNDIIIDQDTALTAPEVILAATSSLQLKTGASISATGALVPAEAPISAPAGTALVRDSTGTQVALNSSGAGVDNASITVAVDASITAPAQGSLSLDAGGTVDFEGSLSAAQANVRFGGTQIALGAAPADFQGFNIGPALTKGLAGAELTLDASDSVLFFGPVNLSLASLVLDAPGLNAMTADASLAVTAASITLESPSSQPYTPPTSGSGTVSLAAGHLVLGPGTVEFGGVASATLAATEDLTVTRSGTLGTPGSLTISSPIMQSDSGQVFDFVAGTDLVTALNGKAAPTTALSGYGGTLGFTGSTVTLGGNIILPGGEVTATATGPTGDVTIPTGTAINVSGFSETFDGDTRSAGGGTVNLDALGGDIIVAPNAVIDVSAGTGAAGGGSLSLAAPKGGVSIAGTVAAAGAAGQPGGSLSVDAQQLDFGSLLSLAGTAGFSQAVDIHQRGPGDFVIGSGATLRATDVELTADGGSVRVLGSIDASTDLGGTILLAAADDIEIGGTLTAGSATRADRGGTVELFAANGGLYLDSGSVISVGGLGAADTGTVWMRAPQSSVLTVLSGAPEVTMNGSISGAANVYLEGYKAYTDTSGSIGDAQVAADPVNNPWYADAATFMTNAGAVASALGHGSDPTFTVLPGIEIDAPGDLTISSPWDLSAWRFGPNGTVPGILTIRTGGNLYVDQSISDGFPGLDPGSGFTLDSSATTSWSYRLSAGALLTSSNPLAVRGPTESAPPGATGGSVLIAPGELADPINGVQGPTMIRTGTGNIWIAAAQDLTLGNQASVIYTAGTAGPGLPIDDTPNSQFQDMPYPVGGGNIDIRVGQDVVGAPTNQLFTDWLWRVGISPSDPQGYQPTAWAPSYGYFEQGIGALGGGDVTVVAGRNILDLGANVPSTGVPLGTGQAASTTLSQVNDGVLRITAGGDIEGGKFLDMAGDAFISAGGAINIGSPQMGSNGQTGGLYPVLGVGSGQFQLQARQSIEIDAIVDPTMLPMSADQIGSYGGLMTGFATYTDASSVSLLSVGGDVTLANRTQFADPLAQSSVNLGFGSNGSDGVALRVVPPTLQAVALGGDVNVNGTLALWPSPQGNLNLLAQNSITLNNIHVIMSDADPAMLPTVTNPSQFGFASDIDLGLAPFDAAAIADPATPGLHAGAPVHGGSFASNGQPDAVPARIVALSGDISFDSSNPLNALNLDLSKPVDIVAGGNITNLTLTVQQFSGASVSSIIAGGEIDYPAARDVNGNLVPNLAAVVVAGPGTLEEQAGGDINLGTSAGIYSVGNAYNSALSSGGASLNISAGINSPPQYAAFTTTYLANSDTYDSELISFVGQQTGATGLTKSSALADFQALPVAQQAVLIDQIFFDELDAGGRTAAAPGPTHDNYTQAFNALTTLFPGANPNLAQNQTDPYSGNVLLDFSRIYTLQGGNIDMLVPGGGVDVGLATAPASFGITKTPAQLGIVAQSTGSVSIASYGDIEVNQSRVFAADGGNILMWSTEGNIDAGRGAKTAISAPPPVVTISPNGSVVVTFPPALTGSGIQALATSTGTDPGDVDLFAPHGVVNANDAGIVAGNLTIAATAVLGASNITVSGTAVGVPVEVTGLGASLAAASGAGTATSNVAQSGLADSTANSRMSSQAQAALGWLDVFVLGLGEDQCQPTDTDCLKRQQNH
jgi:filamentous hemagglutinin